ncbi:MAG: hypothetical protein FWG53_11200, partial [Clostridiales bacterium]|nr:hypothetical protein [Clostridiales bacterium]
MRSLRDYSGSNIFRYHDFAEDERELVSTEAPYIIFTDEDLAANYAAPEAEEEAETPEAWEDAESQEELAGEEGDGGSKESAEASFAALLVEKAEKEAESITAEAREKADAALAEAELKASEIFAAANKEGYEKGYDKGFADGSEEGANRAQSASRDRWRRFFGAVDEACWDIDARKAEILQKN